MISEFLTDLFGDHEGYVYSPVKDKGWEQYFFQWPQEREALEEHIGNYNGREVYISPVLFNDRRIAAETFKGTNFLWTEFDGNSESVPADTIKPTIKVQSSNRGHEHWYWKLDHFLEDKVLLEDLTRRIAFHYGADLSAWDYQQVLRPVDTWNHKRNKPVTLLDRNDTVYSLAAFLDVPIPPPGTKVDIQLGELPSKELILAKYNWKIDALDLMFKDIATGKRSDALVRLAHEAVEAGCSNEETYVLLEERDSVWGKFVGRTDRDKRLQGIIATVRKRKALNAEIVHEAPEVYRFHDFMKTNINLQWAIEGLLPVAGSLVVFGPPGVGKSTFALRLAMDLSLGVENFLAWRIVNRQRTLFISLEMQHYEVKAFFEDMSIPQDVQQQLQTQFFIWPIGNAYPFDTPDQQAELIKYIKLYQIECIIIDSLSLSMYGSVMKDDDVKRLNSFLNEDVRKKLKCSYMFIHHPRKQTQAESGRGPGQDDSFGSQFIVANAQTVVILSQRVGSPKLQVEIPKSRMSLGMTSFEIQRTPNRGFTLIGDPNAPLQEQGTSDKKPDDGSLGSLLNI